MIKKSDNQDIEFIVSPLVLDNTPVNPLTTSWKLEMWTGSNNKIIIERSDGEPLSTGQIEAKCTSSASDIRIYAKGSKTPYGKGNLYALFTLYAYNVNFPDGKQIIKTLDINTNIIII
ncbi:MAG: hypothetical protein RR293_06665 [Bacteroidales bacterium]